MTTYHLLKVNLSEGQKWKLAKAIEDKTPLTIRLKKNETKGNDELMLTADRIGRLEKSRALKKGVELKISKKQVRNVVRDGGGLFSALMPIMKSVGPTLAKTLGLSALVGLASEGAGQVVKKISGQGQIGGYLIPPTNLAELIAKKTFFNKQTEARHCRCL